MNRTWKLPAGFAICILAITCAGSTKALDRAEMLSAAASITTEELKTLVDVLADDTFEGREAGSRGGRAAGNLPDEGV